MSDCIFCKGLPRVMENDLCYALYDIHPVSPGHALIIPKRHFEQIFEATSEEMTAIRDLLVRMKGEIDSERSPDGYNVWVNCGEAAGQIVMHAHLHLIPRYRGQAVDVRGHAKAGD
ncbi:MAG: HIT family protein [Elusimicrobia bacterium]|nr:HIT family protein [Elusimicrobiota bacterium]